MDLSIYSYLSACLSIFPNLLFSTEMQMSSKCFRQLPKQMSQTLPNFSSQERKCVYFILFIYIQGNGTAVIMPE